MTLSVHWEAKRELFVNGVYFKKGTLIEVDSILINKTGATVGFFHDSYRITMKDEDFQKKFKERVDLR